MRTAKYILIVTTALIFVLGIPVSAATVTQAVTYQGKLTDAAGNPLTGTNSVTFNLYGAATGGTALAGSTQSVTSVNGLFTTSIAVDQKYFDGRALWLGVKVGTDPEMTPRQEIRPVPYALGLRPGAVIRGEGVSDVVKIGKDDAEGAGLNITMKGAHSPGIFANTSGGISPGIISRTVGMDSDGLIAFTGGEESEGVLAVTNNRNSTGVRALTFGPYSAAIFGESMQDAGVSGKGKTGGSFTTNQPGTGIGDLFPGVDVITSFAYNPGIRIYTTNYGSDGLFSNTVAGGSRGVVARTHGYDADAVYAWTQGTSSEGVYAETKGPKSPALRGDSADDVGVYGVGKGGGYFTTNQPGTYLIPFPGVNVTTAFAYNPGVGVSTAGYGSNGINVMTGGILSRGVSISTAGGNSEGIHVDTNADSSTGVSVYTLGGGSEGLDVYTTGFTSDGIITRTSGKYSSGISAYTHGSESTGVYASTGGDNSQGVSSYTSGAASSGIAARTEGPVSDGVNVTTEGLDGHGITVTAQQGVGIETNTYSGNIWYTGGSFRNFGAGNGAYGSSRNKYGIVGNTDRPDQKYGIYTDDYLYAKGTQVPSSDVAEYMPVMGEVEPGTVLVIGKGGVLSPSSAAYDTRVAGIVSTDPGVSLGTNEEGNPGETQVAVAGRVPCRVDASYGAIVEGDLLTTSETPGHAMKAQPTMINGRGFYPDGTILGKAMGSLEFGTGVIKVLVTLQ